MAEEIAIPPAANGGIFGTFRSFGGLRTILRRVETSPSLTDGNPFGSPPPTSGGLTGLGGRLIRSFAFMECNTREHMFGFVVLRKNFVICP